MKKLFAALTFVIVFVLAITAELWVATLTGWTLALLGVAAVGLIGRAARC